MSRKDVEAVVKGFKSFGERDQDRAYIEIETLWKDAPGAAKNEDPNERPYEPENPGSSVV